MNTEYVLRTQNLTKTFGRYKAVNHVSMNVRKGDIYGFIGKNGAGKTTFMKMISGLLTPTEGSIELFGMVDENRKTGKEKNLLEEKGKTLEVQRKRIGCLIEAPGFYLGMTAEENMNVVCRILGITEKNIVSEMLNFVGLSETGKKKVKNFSMGMKQRLGIAISLIRNPDFLILDEPINGLDPTGIREIRDLLTKLNQERQITILISSHILGELSKIATRYGIIRDGVLIEEFDRKALEEKCRRCQKIIVDDPFTAARILEETLAIKSYDVPDTHMIRIFERLDESADINRALIMGGIALKESRIEGQDLESYFVDLMEV